MPIFAFAGDACIWSTGSPRMRRICSTKRWRSRKTTHRRCLGLALVAADGFEGKANELAQKASEDRSEAVRSAANCWRASRWKTTIRRRPSRKPTRRLRCRLKRWSAMAILATVDWLDDKADDAVDRPDSQDQSEIWRSVRDRRPFLRHQPALRRRHQAVIARRSRWSPTCGARAASWASI